jgi:phage-related protein
MTEFLEAAGEAQGLADGIDKIVDRGLDTLTSGAETVADLVHGDTDAAAGHAASTLEHGASLSSMGLSDKVESHYDQFAAAEGLKSGHDSLVEGISTVGSELSDLASGVGDTMTGMENVGSAVVDGVEGVGSAVESGVEGVEEAWDESFGDVDATE